MWVVPILEAVVEARQKLLEWVDTLEARYDNIRSEIDADSKEADRSVWKETVKVLMAWIESLERRYKQQPEIKLNDGEKANISVSEQDETEVLNIIQILNEHVSFCSLCELRLPWRVVLNWLQVIEKNSDMDIRNGKDGFGNWTRENFPFILRVLRWLGTGTSWCKKRKGEVPIFYFWWPHLTHW